MSVFADFAVEGVDLCVCVPVKRAVSANLNCSRMYDGIVSNLLGKSREHADDVYDMSTRGVRTGRSANCCLKLRGKGL